MLRLYRLSAQNAPSAQVNVSPQLWMNSFCGWVLHATTCRNTAAFYYNSVLIIYNVMYMTVRVIVINIIVVCPGRDACWRENLRTNEALLVQRNSTKCISYEINNSRPISTIYEADKMFWNNLYPTWSKNSFTLPVSIWLFLKIEIPAAMLLCRSRIMKSET